MFPSSASSSSQGSMASSGGGGGGLMRYGSAPSSLLSTAVDSVIVPGREFEAQTHLRPAAMANHNDVVSRRNREEQSKANTTIGLQTSSRYGGGGGGGSLLRQSSSPAGFLNQLAAAAGDVNGFSITRGIGSYNSKGIADESSGSGLSRLNSQHSFTGKEALSRISEEAEDHMATGLTMAGIDHNNAHKPSTHSYGMGSWEHTSNPIMFSVAPPNRPKNHVDPLDNMESQFQFSISQTAQDMSSMEKLLNIPRDSVTCKIRAKRGCATHPRSIAERERRTRISGKLKKLQDLVPNMDKQTSYSDMLDLAVQHIKTLQNQVQKLNDEMEGCKCGCKKSRDS